MIQFVGEPHKMKPALLVFVAVAVTTVVSDIGEIPLPPRAGEAHFAPDPKADALMKEQTEPDAVMDFMENLMTPVESDEEMPPVPVTLEVELPPMPPRASEADHSVDPIAEALVRDNEQSDPVLTFLEAQMKRAGSGDHSDKARRHRSVTAEQAAAEAEKNERQLKALDQMDDDLASFQDEQDGIKRSIIKRKKIEAAKRAKESRMQAISPHIFTAVHEPVVPAAGKGASTAATAAPLPPHVHKYRDTPQGASQEKADAALAKGASSAAKEDWRVEQEAYNEIHPHHHKKVKKVKALKRTPLKHAHASFEKGMGEIRATKKLLKFHPKLMSVAEAKVKCGKVRTNAKDKCSKATKAAGLYCKTLKITKEQCAERKLHQAALCKVAHETAYNSCLALYKKAKANEVTEDHQIDAAGGSVKAIATNSAGSHACSKLFATSHKTCAAKLSAYKAKCHAAKRKAMVAMVVEELVEVNNAKKAAKKVAKKAKKTSKKAAKKAAKKAGKAIKAQAKKASSSLKAQAKKAAKKAAKLTAAVHKNSAALKGTKVSPAALKAARECHKLKAAAKTSCDTAAYKAKSACTKALKGSKVYEDFSM